MKRVGTFGAAVLVTGLLAAYQGVVRQSVTQGTAARVETARQAQARWACDRMPQRDLRLRCQAGM